MQDRVGELYYLDKLSTVLCSFMADDEGEM